MNFVNESIRQNRFWLRIMQEHALFIRLGLPCDEIELINEAQELEDVFERLRNQLEKLKKCNKKVSEFNSRVIDALDRIINFKSNVLEQLSTCTLGGSNLPLLIDHIRREAIRFRTILLRLENDINVPNSEQLLQEEIFWLRIMGEHAKFIAHLLDPSERNLVEQSRQFAERFETLRLQARDLESMVVPRTFENWLLPENIAGRLFPPGFGEVPESFEIPRLQRFNTEVIETTEEIRNFKSTALQLIEACKVLSIIPPLLADHILREAEMALEDLRMANKDFANQSPQECFNQKKNTGLDQFPQYIKNFYSLD